MSVAAVLNYYAHGWRAALGCDVQMESRIPEPVRGELTSLGHKLTITAPYSGRMGGGQAVMSKGPIHMAGSDPRKDGEAVPENPAFFSPGKRK